VEQSSGQYEARPRLDALGIDRWGQAVTEIRKGLPWRTLPMRKPQWWRDALALRTSRKLENGVKEPSREQDKQPCGTSPKQDPAQ
jgi:hypothetical protein